MNKKNLIVATGMIVTFTTVFHQSMQMQIAAGFPTLDPKLTRKAYNKMLRTALAGKLPVNFNELDNDAITRIFLDIYRSLEQKA